MLFVKRQWVPQVILRAIADAAGDEGVFGRRRTAEDIVRCVHRLPVNHGDRHSSEHKGHVEAFHDLGDTVVETEGATEGLVPDEGIDDGVHGQVTLEVSTSW